MVSFSMWEKEIARRIAVTVPVAAPTGPALALFSSTLVCLFKFAPVVRSGRVP